MTRPQHKHSADVEPWKLPGLASMTSATDADPYLDMLTGGRQKVLAERQAERTEMERKTLQATLEERRRRKQYQHKTGPMRELMVKIIRHPAMPEPVKNQAAELLAMLQEWPPYHPDTIAACKAKTLAVMEEHLVR